MSSPVQNPDLTSTTGKPARPRAVTIASACARSRVSTETSSARRLQRDARQVAAVRDVDDVPAPLADHLGHGREHARPVRSPRSRGGRGGPSGRAPAAAPTTARGDRCCRRSARPPRCGRGSAPGYSTSAASPAAPAPSTTVFSISAAERDRRLDVLLASRRADRRRARRRSRASACRRSVTAMPSAIVGSGLRRGSAAERVDHAGVALDLHADDLDVGAPALGRDRDAGRRARRRRQARRSCRRREPRRAISRPTVPWPAMIARVVERGHERARRSRPRNSSAAASAPAKSAPASTTSASWTSVRVILVNGVSAGMTIVAGMPSRWAW